MTTNVDNTTANSTIEASTITTPVSHINTTSSVIRDNNLTTNGTTTIEVSTITTPVLTSPTSKFDVYNEGVIIFNAVMFGVLPLLCILIRLKNKNIPKIELFGAWASLAWYAQTIFYSRLYGHQVIDYYTTNKFDKNSNFAVNIAESLYRGMLIDLGVFLSFIIPINIFVVTPGFLANWFCCWYCMLSGLEDDVVQVRKLIQDLEVTGPTMVKAKMKKLGDTKNWNFSVRDVHQFVYKSWKNDSITGVDKMEKVLEKGKVPLKIKFELEIKPEDEKTEIEYLDWCWGSPILEEIVTTPDHLKFAGKSPDETTPSLQVPYLASNRHTKPLADLPRNAWFISGAQRNNHRYKR